MKYKRIYIEITNSCNLNCSFCTNEKGNRFLNINEIEDIFKQIKEYSENVYLHVLGEPLIHPNIEEIFDLANKYNLKINLVTNGTLLKEHLNILNKKTLRKLSVSVHSIKETKVSDEYFKTLLDIIDNYNDKYIELRFYEDQNNTFINTLKDKYQFISTDRINSYKLKENVYVLYGNYFKWPNINDEIINNIGYCHGGIDQIAILSNKDVTLCCLDPKGYNKIGNLNEKTFKEIINDEKYIKTINELKNKRITKDLCKKCSYRLKFFK